MKKITKTQERQIDEVVKIWKEVGMMDLQFLLVIFHAILSNKVRDFFKRVNSGQTIEEIGNDYMAFHKNLSKMKKL